MYKVLIIPQAAKDIKKLSSKIIDQLKNKVSKLKENPFSPETIKLTVDDGYRIRMGDYRILYRVSVKEKTICIYRIKHRKDAYR